jgi:acetyltransferase-like isoleucine patch superfamily enzyme
MLYRLLSHSQLATKFYFSMRNIRTSTKIKGRNNNIDAAEAFLLGCNIQIIGDNNRVSIGKGSALEKVRVRLFGNNLRLNIGERAIFGRGSDIFLRDNGGSLEVGDDCGIGRANLYVAEDERTLRIGDDCLVSWDVEVRCSDSHAIFEQQTKTRINFAENIEIGNHVWIGLRCVILKGATIGSGSVVGAGSVVTKSVPANVVVVGNPARVVRSGVVWHEDKNLRIFESDLVSGQ